MIIIAHNIRSLHNVGSIFRNAAAFGIEKLYLTGYTAIPPRKEIAKVALGGELLVPWEQKSIDEAIAECRANGFRVYGLETGPDANDITQSIQGNIALVLGNEVEGIEKTVCETLDGLLEIPMDKKRSLNVSVASGIAMYLLRSN
ncbi:MAG: TrmH family RNA methyltransferase [Patescibacteria group bacterium]|jgi:tRNA G18 (ribose-2'-O)-methylase SpoU